MFVLLPPQLAISKLTTLFGIGLVMEMRSTTRIKAEGLAGRESFLRAGFWALSGGMAFYGLFAGLLERDSRVLYLVVSSLVTISVWTVLKLRDTVDTPNRGRNLGHCDIYGDAGFMVCAAGTRSNGARILKAVRK